MHDTTIQYVVVQIFHKVTETVYAGEMELESIQKSPVIFLKKVTTVYISKVVRFLRHVSKKKQREFLVQVTTTLNVVTSLTASFRNVLVFTKHLEKFLCVFLFKKSSSLKKYF